MPPHARLVGAQQPPPAGSPVPDSVIGKVGAILEALSTEEFGLGLSSLARRSQLPKATVYRLCAELTDLGMVERTGTTFRLGPRLFELGSKVWPRRVLRDQALPYMEDLFIAFRSTIHFAVLDGNEVLYIEKITGHKDYSTPSRVGGRMPLHCTAVGKALLAFSPAELLAETIANGLKRQTPFTIVTPQVLAEQLLEIRRTCLAFDREETELRLSCVATPVLGYQGRLAGAMSLSSTTFQFKPEEYASELKRKARELGVRLDRLGLPSPSH